MAKKIFGLVFILYLGINSVFAQGVEMADALRSNGKIYVVVAVLTVIFIGLGIYLFTLDKKLSKLEKQIKK